MAWVVPQESMMTRPRLRVAGRAIMSPVSTMVFLALFGVALTQGGGSLRALEGNLLLLRSYDRLATVDVAEPSRPIHEWNLATSIRDISGVASSNNTLLVLGRSPGEESACVYALTIRDSELERVTCGQVVAVSADATSEKGFILEREIGNPDAVQVLAIDLASRPVRVVSHSNARLPAVGFSVANRGERIVLESEGFLFDLDRQSGELTRLAAGSSPELSPDGMKVAFLRDGDLYEYDYGTNVVRSILKRRFWQTRLVGALSWGPSGEYLSVSAPAGIAGKQLECRVVSESGELLASFRTGTKWCGPWMQNGR